MGTMNKFSDRKLSILLGTFLFVAAVSIYAIPEANAQNATGANATGTNTTGGNQIAIPQGASLPPSTESELYGYEPAETTVPVGTTVTWTNNDGALHTATAQTFNGNPVATGDPQYFDVMIAPTQSGDYTFTEAGDYEYFCSLHPFMKAKITVQ